MTLTRNNSGKSRALSSLVAGVLLAFASVALASVPDERRVTMTYADGNLSLSAKDVPLQQVMQEVGQLIGARVHWVEQPQQTPLSVEFRNLPLDPALRRILRDRNFLARYRTDAISTKLIEVIILSNIETSTLAEQLPAEGPPSLPETTVPANPAWANGEERDLHAIEESISTEAEPWFVEAAIDATERAHNGQGAAEVLLQLFDE